ncbi:MAG: Gfo/Idh/MocA family oxidoreductase [Spirochaetia bacterium]|nr:Gfo/Idh/MocA family oxidoreductase [Spirochaetia bacterium]
MVKVGIVGLGRSGWNIHAHALAQLPDMYKIVAVCDADAARRQEAEKRFGCKSYTDFKEFLKDGEVELAVIATPSHFHASNAMDALKAGKNVVCEKPMATTLKDADAMIATAKKTKRILSLFHNRRYSPEFVKIREILATGKLGRIVLVKMSWNGFSRRWDWQTLKKFGGGSLNNTGPHAIDQALHLFGDEDPEITSVLDRTLTLGDADDHVKIVFTGKNRPTIDIEISSACAYPQDFWVIMGTQGGLRGSMSELHWKYFDPKKQPARQLETSPTPDRSYNKDELVWEPEEHWKAGSEDRPQEQFYYRELHATLTQGAPLAVTPESARRVMWVFEQVHKTKPLK